MAYLALFLIIYLFAINKKEAVSSGIDHKKDNILRNIEINYGRLITATANQFNIDHFIIYAIIRHESGGDSKALGKTGDYGLMQITQPCLDDFNRIVLSNQGGYSLN